MSSVKSQFCHLSCYICFLLYSQDILSQLYSDLNLACGLLLPPLSGGMFEEWRYALTNREPYYESVRLKQFKPEVLSKSFHLLRMEMK